MILFFLKSFRLIAQYIRHQSSTYDVNVMIYVRHLSEISFVRFFLVGSELSTDFSLSLWWPFFRLLFNKNRLKLLSERNNWYFNTFTFICLDNGRRKTWKRWRGGKKTRTWIWKYVEEEIVGRSSIGQSAAQWRLYK